MQPATVVEPEAPGPISQGESHVQETDHHEHEGDSHDHQHEADHHDHQADLHHHEHATDLSTPLAAVPLADGQRLRVAVTTNIIADLATNVGGEAIDLVTLLPLGADPHAFQPTPRDVVAVSESHVLLVNGAGLEEFLPSLLAALDDEVAIVDLSAGIPLREMMDDHDGHDDHGHEHGEHDPHFWLAPHLAMLMVEQIEQALSTLDPANAHLYHARANAYIDELEALDTWVNEQIATIPPERRYLVSDHHSFGYFAERYGLEVVGAVIPSFSTVAGPSAQELAALEDAIGELDVRAVFVGSTVAPIVAERVAEDTGVSLVFVYTGSLGAQGSGADSYLDMMRYNTLAIVEALRP